MSDPFATAPAPAPAPAPEEAQQQPVASSPWDSPPADAPKPAPAAPAPVVAQSASGDLSVTFKGTGNFDYPWIVPKYSTVEEALIDLGEESRAVAGMSQAEKWAALFTRAVKMNAYFGSLGGDAPPQQRGGGGGGGQRSAPQPAQEAPGGEKRYCEHGEMTYKTGVSKKNGKAWKAFMCPSNDRDNECKAQFLR
ncbi:ribonucleoside reductase class II [Mycobacterium phage Anthony]|uniref:Uncharacterized protein n=1 Tax=Mycobacterium phage Anthony TaxID=2599857 RepID=A0A5J6TKA0_9CAUD|nr:ribonucleoside reductase class II [Mycobacterium phage Anthony]QFG10417.1 hypothetical protein PBI_ANTHONY_46 [Mycobacterium phage Anthony]